MQPNFDFITTPQKRGLGQASIKQRIMLVGGLAVALILVVTIVGAVLGASSGKAGKAVGDLAAYQAELKRIIAIGKDKSRDATLQNKALTASYTLESDYQTTLKMMDARGVKITKELASRYNGTETDAKLDSAEKSNTFDSVYAEIYKEKLTKYKAKLAEVYPELNPQEQAIIKSQSNHAKLLLGEEVATQ